jgi:hypothetical protein
LPADTTFGNIKLFRSMIFRRNTKAIVMANVPMPETATHLANFIDDLSPKNYLIRITLITP